MIKLKPFQDEGVAFLTSKYHAILADDMGLGKTVQAIRAMDAICPNKVLIVCPAGPVKLSWFYTIQYESSDLRLIQNVKTGADLINPHATVYIISYDLLSSCQYKFAQMQIDLLICDEAHYMRGITAKRTWAVLGEIGVARNCKYKWMLTGTPIEHKPIDLFPVLVTLFNKTIQPYGSYEKFAKRFAGAYFYQGNVICKGATHKDELATMLEPIMLRRKKEDVLDDLPPLTTEVVYFEATAASKEIIDKEPEMDMSMTYRADLSKHRQELAMAKIPQALAYINELLETNDKLVIFGYHHAVIDTLMASLQDLKPVKLVGGMSDKQKRESVELFVRKKEVRVFVGNVEAAGTGIDGLQKVCSTMLFVEFDLRPGKIEQAIDRLHRMLQVNRVLALFGVIEGSWESRKLQQILGKMRDNEQILNRRTQDVDRNSNSEFSRCD